MNIYLEVTLPIKSYTLNICVRFDSNEIASFDLKNNTAVFWMVRSSFLSLVSIRVTQAKLQARICGQYTEQSSGLK